MVYSDRRHTLRSLASELKVSTYTVHDILKKELGESIVCARWVLRLLKEHERAGNQGWLFGRDCLLI